jgi:hypothetical protein
MPRASRSTPGSDTITVRAAEIVATARVQVASSDTPPITPPLPVVPKAVRWQGDVPPQKWMNFYMKVLSPFATTPGLKLQVHFELPADGNVSQAKVEEVQTALRELGLSEKLEHS